jgi:predicted nucleotidyltransferase
MSDWDIAVYFNEHSKRDGHWPEFILEAELSRTIGAPVQVIVLNKPLDPVFGFEIVKYSILLLDRKPNVRIDFENRILRHYHDWQYFLKRQLEAEQHLLHMR